MAFPAIKITVLGSGTSAGVPTVGCHCDVCTSADPKDNRLRPSILVSWDGHYVVIDTTPDFRTQAIRSGLPRLDAVLFTHSHADHIMGLDDVRPFNFRQRAAIPVYGAPQVLNHIRKAFWYIFDDAPQESAVPKLTTHELDGDVVELCGLDFKPILLQHGKGHVYGFKFGRAAYLTDHSDIPEESLAQLHGLDVLFLDALRYKPHPTHSTVDRSLRWVEQLKPRRAFFTHICHDLGHARAQSMLPANVRLAYDGLEIDVDSTETAL